MSNQEMSVEERNLISVAYKNAVGSRRASWRIISSVEQKEASKGNEQNVEMAKAYRIRVEAELNKICGEILELIDTNLVPMSTAGESKVFYFKMKGDYYRYIAEFTEGEGKSGAANAAHGAYNQAMEVATTDLVVTHPIRLGLALNFSVFHYEVSLRSGSEAGCPDFMFTTHLSSFTDIVNHLNEIFLERFMRFSSLKQGVLVVLRTQLIVQVGNSWVLLCCDS